MNLVVNPLASIETVDGSDELISGGPVPGRGMQLLHLTSGEQPRLHGLFQELRTLGLATLDLKADLHEEDISVLREHGILVEADQVPERPLFSCMLDDVEPTADVPDSLIVNPSIDFQPFDLTKFPTWIREKNLSPHQATVWIVDPRTEARWGYWLTPDQAALIGTFQGGAAIDPKDIEPTLVGKLVEADILINQSAVAVNRALNEAAQQFARDRYAILSGGIVPAAQLRALQAYYRRYVEQGFMTFGDRQVDRRFAAYCEPVSIMVLESLVPLMQKLAGLPIRRTYSYSAVYAEGAVLNPHIDRGECEYSFSFQLDYSPMPDKGVSPWPLYVSINEPGNLIVDPSRDRAIHLPNGGFLAYKGRELVHYRTPLFDGHRSASLFLHYVAAEPSNLTA